MKKRIRIMIAMVMSIVCCLVAAQPALAADQPGISVPVKVSLSGTLPSQEETFTVTLKADDAAYPMPTEAENGVYSISLTGAESKNFPTMVFDKVGIYTYTIFQTAGANKKCTYDSTVYTLQVTVTNDESDDNEGLVATVAMRPGTGDEKLPEAEFKNVYETEQTPVANDTPKTGDDAQPLLYAGLVLVSIGVIAGLIVTKNRNRKHE